MSQDHKNSLALGREQSRIVGAYLAAVNKPKRKRGRQITVESVTARLNKAKTALASATPIERLNLTQQINDCENALKSMKHVEPVDIEKLEQDFIKVAPAYAASKKITRASFIECGVEKRVLEAAGI